MDREAAEKAVYEEVVRLNLLDPSCSSVPVSSFVRFCKQSNIPLSAGKSVVRALRATILGGDLDGLRGMLSHSREKTMKLMLESLGMVCLPKWVSGNLRHWAGLFCLVAQFRRPLFSILQEIFPAFVTWKIVLLFLWEPWPLSVTKF